MNSVVELLKSHRSIRKFTERPIEPELFEELVRAGQGAATSSFLQGATIIRVKDRAKREKIAQLAGNQAYVASAAAFMIFCADLKRAGNWCREYGKSFEGDFTEHFIIATVDVALMAQSMVCAAESVGLGICYIGGIRNNPGPVSELLELPRGVYRLPLSVIVKEDSYNEQGDRKAIESYDAQVRDYYATRTGGGHGISWSEQVSVLLSEKSRPHMRGFLAEQGFTFK